MKRSLIILHLFVFAAFSVQSETIQVTAQDYSYTPANITINVGDTVIWTNNGGTHDVNGEINTITGLPFNNPESFDSETTNTPGSIIYTHVFTATGEYNYDCSVGSHAANGMVGTINVIPATVFDIIAESSAHDTLEIAITTAGLVDALSGDGPFTVFAPTDAAFAAVEPELFQTILNSDLLTPILLHHVHNEGAVLSTDLENGMMVSTLFEDNLLITQENDSTFKVDNATIIITDIIAANGVVHVIDAVLIPEIPEGTTVFDIIENSPDHTILETALIESDLDEALSGDGPFTVFAPTDAAFDALPDGLLDELLADPMGELANVLKYHVHAGLAMSTDLENGMMVSTLQGTDLTVTIDNNNVMINNAMVTIDDVEADNGVVHIINAVLVPEEPTSIDNLLSGSNIVYMYTINLLGEKVERESNDKVLIDIYSNGTVIKRYNSNK